MEDLLAKEKQKVEVPRTFNVVMFNDDYTHMDFVIIVLVEVFGKTVEEAVTLAVQVHKDGQGIAGTYSRDIAETKVTIAMDKAKEAEFPFRLEVQPA
tara:strand:- start:556 stop:846 length:291 start_codon:yes stop_codon:yes gene_type:complete